MPRRLTSASAARSKGCAEELTWLFPVPGGRELGPLRQDAYPPAGRGLASFVSGPVCPPAPQAPHPVPLSRRLAKRPSADGVMQSVREVLGGGDKLRSQLHISPRGEAGPRGCDVGAGFVARSTPPLTSTSSSAVTEPTILSPSAMMVPRRVNKPNMTPDAIRVTRKRGRRSLVSRPIAQRSDDVEREMG